MATVALSLAVVACSDPAGDGAPGRGGTAAPSSSTVPGDPTGPATPGPSPLAALAPALPPAFYDPGQHRAPTSRPARLGLPAIGVRDAEIVPVGVEPDGQMEVPPADQVGWYRFGSRPGRPGTTVLAAHVAFDGRDGVFRRLEQLRPGTAVVVADDDGTEHTFRVVAVERHVKTELPADVFSGVGPEQLVLITCGGRFDPSTRRYDSNVVVRADRAT